jgi:hypothetical protein
LLQLSVSTSASGGADVPLSPPLVSGVVSYAGVVAHGVSQVFFTATPADANAAMTLNETETLLSGVPSSGRALAVGLQAFAIRVGGAAGPVYTVRLLRGCSGCATSSALASLRVDGTHLTPLAKLFDAAQLSYTANVDGSRAVAVVRAAPADSARGLVFIQGVLANAPGAAALREVALGVGTTSIAVRSVGGDASERTYTLAVTRRACWQCPEGSEFDGGERCVQSSLWLRTLEAPSGGTVNFGNTALTSGLGAFGNANYVAPCGSQLLSSYGSDFVLRVQTSGQYVDYIRAAAGASSYCEVVTSRDKHLWAPSLQGGFLAPAYAAAHYGGSADGWLSDVDGRSVVPFWGSETAANAGGCCAVPGGAWGQAIVLDVARSSPADLACTTGPAFAQQPTPSFVAVDAGQEVVFRVAVDSASSRPVQLQWLRDGSAIAGATAPELRLVAGLATEGIISCRLQNLVGSVLSSNATLNINRAPIILVHPSPAQLAVNEGQTVTISVTASSPSHLQAPTFEWRRNGVAMNVTLTPFLVLTASQAIEGLWSVRVENSYGGVVSNAMQISVNDPPDITVPPNYVVARVGEAASFSVVATGPGTLSYHWLKDGVNISGATQSTLSFAAVAVADAGMYTVVVSSSLGTAPAQASARLAIDTCEPGSFTTSTDDPPVLLPGLTGLVNDNMRIAFNASVKLLNLVPHFANSACAPSVVWTSQVDPDRCTRTYTGVVAWTTAYVASDPAQGCGFVRTVTASSVNFLLAFRVTAVEQVVLPRLGPVMRDVEHPLPFQIVLPLSVSVSSTSGVFNAAVPVSIASQPSPAQLGVSLGQSVTYSVAVAPSTTAPIRYQWFRNGAALAGATSSSYSLVASLSSEGVYWAQVSNVLGAVNSSTAAVYVNRAPSLLATSDSPSTVNPGASVALSFSFYSPPSSGAVTFQWQHNGVDVPGATQETLSFIASEALEGGYRVRITNQHGSVLSSVMVVNVRNLPAIVRAPRSHVANLGEEVTFSVDATVEEGGVLYQWYKNGVLIANAVNNFIHVVEIESADAGNYSVEVRSSVGPGPVTVWATLTVFNCTAYLPSHVVSTSLPPELALTLSQVDQGVVRLSFNASLKYFDAKPVFPPSAAPACAAAWTWTATVDAALCTRTWRGEAAWAAALDACGFVASETPAFSDYALDFVVATQERMPRVGDHDLVRSLQHRLPWRVRFPKTLTVGGAVSTFPTIVNQASLAEQALLGGNGVPVRARVRLFASVLWPYRLTAAVFDAWPADMRAPPPLTVDTTAIEAQNGVTCADVENQRCQRYFLATLEPLARACYFDGTYRVNLTVECQPSAAASCPLAPATSTVAAVELALFSSPMCPVFEPGLGHTPWAGSFSSAALSAPLSAFEEEQTIHVLISARSLAAPILSTTVTDLAIERPNTLSATPLVVAGAPQSPVATDAALDLQDGPAASANVNSDATLSFKVPALLYQLPTEAEEVMAVRATLRVAFDDGRTTQPPATTDMVVSSQFVLLGPPAAPSGAVTFAGLSTYQLGAATFFVVVFTGACCYAAMRRYVCRRKKKDEEDAAAAGAVIGESAQGGESGEAAGAAGSINSLSEGRRPSESLEEEKAGPPSLLSLSDALRRARQLGHQRTNSYSDDRSYVEPEPVSQGHERSYSSADDQPGAAAAAAAALAVAGAGGHAALGGYARSLSGERSLSSGGRSPSLDAAGQRGGAPRLRLVAAAGGESPGQAPHQPPSPLLADATAAQQQPMQQMQMPPLPAAAAAAPAIAQSPLQQRRPAGRMGRGRGAMRGARGGRGGRGGRPALGVATAGLARSGSFGTRGGASSGQNTPRSASSRYSAEPTTPNSMTDGAARRDPPTPVSGNSLLRGRAARPQGSGGVGGGAV